MCFMLWLEDLLEEFLHSFAEISPVAFDLWTRNLPTLSLRPSEEGADAVRILKVMFVSVFSLMLTLQQQIHTLCQQLPLMAAQNKNDSDNLIKLGPDLFSHFVIPSHLIVSLCCSRRSITAFSFILSSSLLLIFRPPPHCFDVRISSLLFCSCSPDLSFQPTIIFSLFIFPLLSLKCLLQLDALLCL